MGYDLLLDAVLARDSFAMAPASKVQLFKMIFLLALTAAHVRRCIKLHRADRKFSHNWNAESGQYSKLNKNTKPCHYINAFMTEAQKSGTRNNQINKKTSKIKATCVMIQICGTHARL